MQTFYLTDTGKVREHNEDNVIILHNDKDEYVLAVADGMGGHRAGEVASAIVINCLTEEFYALDTLGDKDAAIDFLRDIVTSMNNKIFEYTKENPDSKGMGTTFVCAIKTKDYLLYGNVGDSSGYVIKNKKMHKVTKDHTLVNLLVSTGKLTEEEAKFHPRKNVLMRALGANNPIEIDIFDVENVATDVLLCSDGLTNMLTDDQIEKVLAEGKNAEEIVDKLIRKANARGGKDNISVAYLKKESGDL
jgi:protein phosphatase